MNLFDLGQLLKEARIRQQLTQTELANRTGISLSSISGLERGSLSEIGVVKVLQLFAAVGLELQPRPTGQRRTLDDVRDSQAGLDSGLGIQGAPRQFFVAEQGDQVSLRTSAPLHKLVSRKNETRQRVRHSKKPANSNE